MSIDQWPAHERPRERLLALGHRSLSDAELIAILLGSGIRGKDAVTVARDLLQHSGGLARLLAEPMLARSQPGIGPAKLARLTAALALASRVSQPHGSVGMVLGNPAESAAYCAGQLRHKPFEVFACLFLDARHRVLAFEELFRGTVDQASVHPREVVRACIAHNACAVIFAHNHPSGCADASQADVAITRTLIDVLGVIGVRVLDHLVIGHGQPLSMAERGLI